MDESWDERFKQFLRKTGEDFRRAGEDFRTEAQRLVDAAMDAEKQQRVRDRMNELTQWAQRTAEGVAGAMGEAATKAQSAFHQATDKMAVMTGMQEQPSANASAPPPKARPAAKKTKEAKAPKKAAKARAPKKAAKAKAPKKAGKAKARKPAKKKTGGAKRKR